MLDVRDIGVLDRFMCDVQWQIHSLALSLVHSNGDS